MRRWVSAVLLLVIAGLALVLAAGTARWQRDSRRQIAALTDTPRPSPDATVEQPDLDDLPPPVARYLGSALRPGQRLVRQVTFDQHGELRSDPGHEGWWRYTAHQVVVPGAPGFVWQASVRTAPGLRVAVRDAYVESRGRGRAALWSVVTLADDDGGPEIDTAALLRYLAEAVWYPTALLPGGGLTWRPLDSSRAIASLTDAGTTVELEFRFAANGDLASVFSAGRQRRVEDGYVLTPWQGRFSDYEEVAGMRIPLSGEVEWQIDGRWQAVWRGRLSNLDYTFAD